jgi:hypothetical protein
MNVSIVFEQFVPCRQIIVVKWISDDPTFFKPQEDLYDFQRSGIVPTFGKKHKTTTEQGFFFCQPCDCELKSLANLRTHCNGAQHIRHAQNILFQQELAAKKKRDQGGDQ